jgi:hypothetical protein
VCREVELNSEHQVMERGAAWQLQGWVIRSVELQVVLPILPVVSGFSI